VADRLDAGTRERLEALRTDEGRGTAFAQLAAAPGRTGLDDAHDAGRPAGPDAARMGPHQLLRRLRP